MDLSDIERMTGEYGENWALPHARRLFRLVDEISMGIEYDQEALTYAIYLHDWGAFPRFKRVGVDHALRSRQVAEEEILPRTKLTPAQQILILDAIEYHDYRCVLPVWTNEATLLREADFLDFLGAIGLARELLWEPNQMNRALERARARRDAIRGRFTIPAAQQIADARLEKLNKILAWIAEESFGEL